MISGVSQGHWISVVSGLYVEMVEGPDTVVEGLRGRTAHVSDPRVHHLDLLMVMVVYSSIV